MRRRDGTLYDTLCGLTAAARNDLTRQHVAVLARFGEHASPLLDAADLAVSARWHANAGGV